jgi:DNA-binding IclR family transcriptional regulator
VPEYLRRPLAALVERTGETAYLAVWGTGEIHVLASTPGVRPVRVGETASGPYRHAHARATGKLLLAYAPPELRAAYLDAHPPERLTSNTIVAPDALEAELAAIRRRGYSEDREEFVEGVSCVSAPMLSGDTIVAALTVAAPTPRYESRREELLAAVLAAAGSSQTEPGRAA